MAATHLPTYRTTSLRRDQLYGEMQQLRGDGLTQPLATYVFERLLSDGRHAELMDLPQQVGCSCGCLSFKAFPLLEKVFRRGLLSALPPVPTRPPPLPPLPTVR